MAKLIYFSWFLLQQLPSLVKVLDKVPVFSRCRNLSCIWQILSYKDMVFHRFTVLIKFISNNGLGIMSSSKSSRHVFFITVTYTIYNTELGFTCKLSYFLFPLSLHANFFWKEYFFVDKNKQNIILCIK